MHAGRIACLFFVLAGLASGASAETIFSKSYSYFSIGGRTASELDEELSRRGPQMKSTGLRHPGATQMDFGGSTVTYEQSDGRCRINEVKIKLHTRIILPRWSPRKGADRELSTFWHVLSRDIKRHEERHAEIARQYGKKLEEALLELPAQPDCDEMEARVTAQAEAILTEHIKAQAEFDRVEAITRERRVSRMLKFRADALNGG